MGIDDNIYGPIKTDSTSTKGGIYKLGDHNSGSNNSNSSRETKPSKVIINGILINQKQKLKEEENEFEDNPEEYNKFPKKSKYNDILFSIAFTIQMLLFIGMTINAGLKQNGKKQFIELSLQGLISIGVSIPLILIFFLIWKKVFKIHPVNMIKTSFFLFLVMGLLSIGLLIGNGEYVISLIFGFCIVYLSFFFFAYKSKIPFTGKMIVLVLKLIEKYPSALGVSFISLILSCIYWNIWLFTYLYYVNSSVWSGVAFDYFRIVFLIFNIYWTHLVITYGSYSVVSGLAASWYFYSDEEFNNMPKNPCLNSLYRSITTSFGSIAFGSLLVCIVEFIERIFRTLMRIPGLELICGCMAITTCYFKNILYTFNIYSFSMVAIYGQSFCKSSKKTLNLMMDNNQKLFTTHNYMLITLLSISLPMFLIIGFIVTMILGTINISSEMLTLQLIMYLFIIAKPFDIIFSSVLTILMCLISDPETMQLSKPITFSLLNEHYDF